MALQGSNANLQGSSLKLQGSTPKLQTTFNPQNAGQGILLQNPAVNTSVAANYKGSLLPGVGQSAAPTTNNAGLEAILKQIRDMNAAANAPLPVFDTAAARAKAQAAAGTTVNPVYQDMLNNYLTAQATKAAQQKTQAEMNRGTIDTGLTQSLEDTALGRTRTTEDTTNAMGDIQFGENTFQRQEGRAFDAARTALLGNVSDAGLTESGLGSGQVANAVTDRNIASDAQTQEFENARRDTQLNFSRKLADFDTSDVRAQGSADSSKKQVDFDLQSYLDNAANDENDYRYQNERQRQAEIDSATNANYASYVRDAIAALQRSGANASVVARFGQAYML